MNPGDEVVSPATDGPVPLPPAAGPGPVPLAAPIPSAQPTSPAVSPEAIVRAILAAAGKPWFPSVHAKEAGVPRDSLDEPLTRLREAGLVRVSDWVRGVGQGYALTGDGEAMVNGPVARPGAKPAPAPEPSVWADAPPAVVDERPPLVAPALLLANLIWFFVGVVVAGRLGVPLWGYLWRGNTAVLERLGAVSAPDLLRGEWWRLGTCCFVHGMVWHAAVNLYSLGVAGSVAELLWGRWRALVIYAVSGLGGSCLAMALRPLDPAGSAAVILVGASGAICGQLAAIIAWFLLFRRSLKRKVAADLAWRLWLVFAASVAVSFIPGVSWEGHLGGAAAGFAAAVLLYAIRFGGRAHRVLAAVLLVGLPVASVAGLQTAMKSGERWAPLRDRLAAGSHPDVLPLLEAIRPEAVHPVETEAARFLMLGPKRRTPERTAELRRKVEAVRLAAVDAEKRLALPTGIPAIDVDRPKWVAFAQARAESATLLVTMLNANEVPDEAAWKAWGDSRRHADRLWAEAVVHAAAVKPAAPPPPLPLPPRDRTRDPAPGLDQ